MDLTGAELNTDALLSYEGLSSEYAHRVVDHAETYVSGTVHTNRLENFWSLLKRSIKGTPMSASSRFICSVTSMSKRSATTNATILTLAGL